MLPTLSTPTPAASVDREVLAVAGAVIKTLFLQFPELTERVPDRRAMATEWARGLADFRPEEVSRGLAICRTRKFPPNIGEFSQFCRPALDPEFAWLEAQDGLRARDRGERGVWTHPAVWRAAREMGFEVRGGAFAQHRRRWERILAAEFAAGWGEEVPDAQPRIERKQPEARAWPPEFRSKLAELAKRCKA